MLAVLSLPVLNSLLCSRCCCCFSLDEGVPKRGEGHGKVRSAEGLYDDLPTAGGIRLRREGGGQRRGIASQLVVVRVVG